MARALQLNSAFPGGPNPTQAQFMASVARHQGIMGPPGCGKSEASLRKAEALTAIYPNNEVVIGSRVRLDVVQNTLPHFWRIATPELYKNWCPREKFVNKHDMVLYLHNGSYIRFTGLADSGDFGSANLGGILYMELYHPLGGKNISPEVYHAGDKALRNPNAPFRCTIFDSNKIPRNHWIYQEFGEDGCEGHELFKPTWEENRHNLPKAHVRNMERTWTEGQRAQMMEPGWGQVISGKPVYGEVFNPSIHVNEDLYISIGDDEDEWIARVDPEHPVWIAIDQSYTQPWVTWNQYVDGQWRMLGEIYPSFVMLDKLIREINKYTEDHFKGCAIRYCTGHDVIAHKDTGIPVEVFAQYGIVPRHRPTKSVTSEVEQVIRFMSRLVDGQPAFQISPKCPATREMFEVGYRWAESKGGIVKNVPLKDGFFDNGADSARHFAINVLGIVPSAPEQRQQPQPFASYGSGPSPLGQPEAARMWA